MIIKKTLVFTFDAAEEPDAIREFWSNTTGWDMKIAGRTISFHKTETKDFGLVKEVIPLGKN